MNSVVRTISRSNARSRPSDFRGAMRQSDRRRQRHHGRAGQGYLGHDGHLGVVAVGRSADADRQHQPGSVVLAAAEALRLLRRQHPDLGSARYRRAVYRQGRAEGRRPLCRRRNGSTRASGVPLLVGALAAIDCEVEEIVERHSHAIVIGRVLDLQLSTAHRGAGLLAGAVCRDRPGRGRGQARRGQRSGSRTARREAPERPSSAMRCHARRAGRFAGRPI